MKRLVSTIDDRPHKLEFHNKAELRIELISTTF
jgi:hypothetical protein